MQVLPKGSQQLPSDIRDSAYTHMHLSHGDRERRFVMFPLKDLIIVATVQFTSILFGTNVSTSNLYSLVIYSKGGRGQSRSFSCSNSSR
jgi:hypothetical protein